MTESFEGRKVVVVRGSSGMGLATAHQVIAGGGTAVITGRDQDSTQREPRALMQPSGRAGCPRAAATPAPAGCAVRPQR